MQTNRSCRPKTRQGFTILESVIAIMLLSMAAAMVFTVTFPAVSQAYQNRNATVARQYAGQLLNEILQLPVESSAVPLAISATTGPFQARSQFVCIQDFDGYSSHACFPDGASLATAYSRSEIATLNSICYTVRVDLVDNNFAIGGSGDFVRISVSAFSDPEQDLAIDDRQPLFSVTRLIAVNH